MNLVDLFIVQEKSKEAIGFFLENALSGFYPSEDYFEFPKYEMETTFETESFNEMLEYLLSNSDTSYTFYFKHDNHSLFQDAIIQINKDNSVFFCIASAQENLEKCKTYLSNLYPNHKLYESYNQALPSSKDLLR